MAQRVIEALKRRGWRIALAESCTGGLVMARLTSVPGASAVFWGGRVVYSGESKRALLGEAAEEALVDGLVSARVTAALARACLAQGRVDMGAAVTGYAGPDAPLGRIGEVHLAVVTAKGIVERSLKLDATRDSVREQATDGLLRLIDEVARAKD